MGEDRNGVASILTVSFLVKVNSICSLSRTVAIRINGESTDLYTIKQEKKEECCW